MDEIRRRHRLRGLLLLIEHEERMRQLEQDKDFNESVERCAAWAMKNISHASLKEREGGYARWFTLRDLQPLSLGASATQASAPVFTYRLERSDVVPSDLAEGALAWAIFPLFLEFSQEPDEGKTRIRVKLADTMNSEEDASGGNYALRVNFQYQHEPLASFRLSEKKYHVSAVVSMQLDRHKDCLVTTSPECFA